jgi:O-antigen/teichoic acid export membrane protein
VSAESIVAPVDHSLSGLLRSTSAPLLVLLVGTLVDLGANVVLGRLLGPENYGDYAVALSAAAIGASFSNLGSSETLPKFYPAYLDSGRFTLAKGFLFASFGVAVLVSFDGAWIGAFYYHALERVTLGHPVAIIWVVVPVLVVNTYMFNFLVAVEAALPMMAMREILRPLVMIGILYLLIVTDRVSDNHSVRRRAAGDDAVLHRLDPVAVAESGAPRQAPVRPDAMAAGRRADRSGRHRL